MFLFTFCTSHLQRFTPNYTGKCSNSWEKQEGEGTIVPRRQRLCPERKGLYHSARCTCRAGSLRLTETLPFLLSSLMSLLQWFVQFMHFFCLLKPEMLSFSSPKVQTWAKCSHLLAQNISSRIWIKLKGTAHTLWQDPFHPTQNDPRQTFLSTGFVFCRIVDFRISKNVDFRNEENVEFFLMVVHYFCRKYIDFGFGNLQFCRIQNPVKMSDQRMPKKAQTVTSCMVDLIRCNRGVTDKKGN